MLVLAKMTKTSASVEALKARGLTRLSQSRVQISSRVLILPSTARRNRNWEVWRKNLGRVLITERKAGKKENPGRRETQCRCEKWREGGSREECPHYAHGTHTELCKNT